MILVDFGLLNGQSVSNNRSVNDSLWGKIYSFFQPPEEYREKYGDYRSPLEFYNGKVVTSPKEWKSRRKEILDQWNEMMGKWPAFIKDQKMEVLETQKREGYLQYHIRFNWLPGQKTEGYLLVPDIKGKKPAVITVYYEPETAIGIGDSRYRDFAVQLVK